MKIKNNEKGITLIALVVTIVVLLILAAVSISTLTGENGIITQANEAGKRSTHGNVMERLNINSSSHVIDKKTDESTLSLIEYLQQEQIIGNEIGENSGKYQINVTKLTTETQKYGNGTATESEKKDVYMLEKDTEENGKVIYEIKYYEKSTGASEVLGELTDTVKVASNEITFNISKFLIDDAGPYIDVNINKGYKAKEGMTWREWWDSSYCDTFITEFNNEFSAQGYGIMKLSGIIDDEWYGYFMFYDTSTIGRGQYVYIQNIEIDEAIDSTKDYILTSVWIAECVYPNSEILVSEEGKTTLAKDIKEKDEIMYFDFEKNVMKTGKVSKVYVHKDATSFVKYTFTDGSYLEATDYHPIYTKEGWKSQTERNGYELPKIGDEVKTPNGWKVITKIETWQGLEDCYDFEIVTEEGERVNNYFANGTLVQGSY